MRKYTTIPHQEIYYGEQWNGKIGNFDLNKKPIITIVLHSTAGGLQGSISRLSNPQSCVSCNYIIDTDGTIYGMVPEHMVAYANGSYPSNQESISIEHVDNNDIPNSRTDSLYNASARLIADISKFYSIPLDTIHVKLHSEIIATRCPNGLDRDRIIREAIALLNPEGMHQYEMPEKVFTNLVTASTNYDHLWAALDLDPTLKGNADSYNVILTHMQAFITSEVANRVASNINIPTVNQAPSVPSVTPIPPVPSKQSVSLWRKDVSEVLADIWASVRGTRDN